ncbi:hypothetical protein BurJ1DRAFT_1772 [Burkholderiales bacterium JOSHI_001]|nr:hypothetical protein BurJ1DRAFT_1772 [Burkholderiales bacterium JOSHI_001]
MAHPIPLRRRLTRQVKDTLKDLRGPLAYRQTAYGQEAEDLLLMRMLDPKRVGFYVEVGSHHPIRFSNTYNFYRRGWRGLCIDPVPGLVRRFARWRPRDIALELGIAESAGSLTFHLFNEPALNTFSPELAAERDGRNNWAIVERRTVPVQPLAAVLAQHLPADVQAIDFMSIDVEGMDLQVLRSNDWTRYRPRIVVTECLDSRMSNWPTDPVVQFMAQQQYFPVAKAIHSVFFQRDSDALGG